MSWRALSAAAHVVSSRPAARKPTSNAENTSVDLARIGWLTIVIGCLVAVLVLIVQGYLGYAAVTFAVAASAAINLR